MVAVNGLVQLLPVSLIYSGTSASIGANGLVTLTAVTSFDVVSVFSNDYDHYQINMTLTGVSGNAALVSRLLSGITAESTASSYTSIDVQTAATTYPSNGAVTGTSMPIASVYQTVYTSSQVFIGNPYKTNIPTSIKALTQEGVTNSTPFLDLQWGNHILWNRYDGIEFYSSGGETFSGTFSIYGMRK